MRRRPQPRVLRNNPVDVHNHGGDCILVTVNVRNCFEPVEEYAVRQCKEFGRN